MDLYFLFYKKGGTNYSIVVTQTKNYIDLFFFLPSFFPVKVVDLL